MKKIDKRMAVFMSLMLFLGANANSQDTRDMTFSKSHVTTDTVPDNQTHKYDFGIGGGIAIYQGDLAPTQWGAYRCISPALQASITRLFTPSFGLRVAGTVGKFAADDLKSSFKESYRDYRRYNFTTSFAELTAMAQWTPFGKRNWRLNPYVMGGAGISYFNVKNDWKKTDFNYFAGENLQQRLAEDSAENHTFFAPVLPLGVGLKLEASQKVSFKLEWINRITFSDYLDGFSKAANPDKNDRYSSVMLSVNFALGKNKSSKATENTITNSNYYHNRSTTKSNRSENSMASNDDARKQNSRSNENHLEQNNQNNISIKELQHKVDLLIAKLDEIQQQNNAEKESLAREQQNKQRDQDANNLANVEKYIIYFSFDHSYLEGESFGKLDQIAKMMKDDPKLNVVLNGYTDLKGGYDYNMKLSSERVSICKDYLRSRGIDANRITTEAFGKARYIVEGTKEQQWRNRRVEVYFN